MPKARTKTKQIQISIEPEILKNARIFAKEENRSFSNFVSTLIKRYMEDKRFNTPPLSITQEYVEKKIEKYMKENKEE